MNVVRILSLLMTLFIFGCPTDIEDPNPPTNPNPQTTTDAAVIETHAPDASLPKNPMDAGLFFFDAGDQPVFIDSGTTSVITDAGHYVVDAGTTQISIDSGNTSLQTDAGFWVLDAGTTTPPLDAGYEIVDSGSHTPPEQSDAGAFDAGPPPVFDCLGIENGSAVLDCNNTCAGHAFMDNCEQCVGGTTGLLGCEQDCNDNWGGIAVWDSCGNCIDIGDMPCDVSPEDGGIDAGPLLEEIDASVSYDSGTLVDDNAADAAVANTEDAGISFYDSGWTAPEADAGNEAYVWDGGAVWMDAGNVAGSSDAGLTIPTLDAGSTPIDQAACREDYFHDNLANLFRRTCALCHTVDGIAYEQGASLVLASPYAGQESDIDALNYQALMGFLNADDNNGSLLWQKPTTALYHGGGEQIQESSEAEFALLDFVSMHSEDMGCELANEAPLTESDLILTDHTAALRFAALLLSNTQPQGLL